jgi:hypothetical protein
MRPLIIDTSKTGIRKLRRRAANPPPQLAELKNNIDFKLFL